MSRFFSKKFKDLVPYVPGEQPQERKYVKLNTNESPYPPSKKATEEAQAEATRLQLYSDPTCGKLLGIAAEVFGVGKENLFPANGSDEALSFAFAAFGDKGVAFCDVTYGFYPIFARQNGVSYREIPLRDDFTTDVDAFVSAPETVILANPNAPTGLTLTLAEIEKIVRANAERVVIVDEAYADFGTESAIPLTKKYDNLLVTMTFSKSRSMAGARLGFAIGNEDLIGDLNTLKYSVNPYNVNRMSAAAGVGALSDEAYTKANCAKIIATREKTKKALAGLGFSGTDSKANFLFIKHDKIGGKEMYERLKEKGVLIRHFETARLADYNRVTVGSDEEMEIFIDKVREILEEKKR